MGFTKKDCPCSKVNVGFSTTKSKPFSRSNLHHSLHPEKNKFSYHVSDVQSCDSSSSSCRNELVNLRCHQMRVVRKLGKRASVTSSRSIIENIDIDKQSEMVDLVGKEWFDQSEGMWLSSGCLSPPFQRFEDQEFRDIWDFDKPLSRGNFLSDGGDLSTDNYFSPVSSSSGRSRFFFDGSRINPIEEASLVLDENLPSSYLEHQTTVGLESVNGVEKKTEGIGKDSTYYLQTEEAVGTWLYSSSSSNTNDSSITCSEGAGSSCELSLYEDSLVVESSWTSVSICEDSSQINDLDRTGVWVSLLDLEDKNFEWISDKEQGFDVFPSDFPSPTYKTKRNYEVPPRDRSRFSIDAVGGGIPSMDSPDSSVHSLSDEKSSMDFHFEQVPEPKCDILCSGTEGDFESLDSGEPLFWPFDPNSYWHAEIRWDCKCISSPCKNRGEFMTSEGFLNPKSVKLKLRKRQPPYLQKNRNIVENSEMKSSWKQRKTIICKNSEDTFSSKQGSARKFVFSSKSTPSTIIDCKPGYKNNCFRRTDTISSKIGVIPQVSSQTFSHNLSKKQSSHKTKISSALIGNEEGLLFPPNRCLPVQDLQSFYCSKMKSSRNLFQKPIEHRRDDKNTLITAKDYQEFLDEGFGLNESSIESLVGMSEFDGHEGINGEFKIDQFPLDECVSKNLMEPLLIEGSCSDSSETNQSLNSLIDSALDRYVGPVEGGEDEISGCCSLGFSQNSVEADDYVSGKDESEVAENEAISQTKVSELILPKHPEL